MLNIPNLILQDFDYLLNTHQIPRQDHSDYRKWLRFYLDFCDKYQHNPKTPDSARAFITKLASKHQSISDQQQAHHSLQARTSFQGRPRLQARP